MANFQPKKHTASEFNGGVEYVGEDLTQGIQGDMVQAADMNNLVESTLYAQQTSETASTTAESAIDIANEALDSLTNITCPPVGYHYIQLYSEPTPAQRWAGTTWEIDTSYTGRTIIGSGGSAATGYIFGNVGGSADAVVVEHFHSRLMYADGNYMKWDNAFQAGSEGGLVIGNGNDVQTNSAGVNGVGKNMPPYMVANFWKRTA